MRCSGLAQARRNRRALEVLPLGQADVAAAGHRVGYVQDILACDADDPRWAGIDHTHRVADVTVPVSSIGGWYDIFLPGQLRDFKILQEAGRPARLTVGPWTHLSLDGTALRESIEFGLAHARGEPPPPRAPVRLYVMGEEAWRDFDAWPPPGYLPQRFHLQPGGRPGRRAARPASPRLHRYRYDPADPTPAVGGVRMTRTSSGRVDNSEAGGPAGRAHLHDRPARRGHRGHRGGQRRDLVPLQPAPRRRVRPALRRRPRRPFPQRLRRPDQPVRRRRRSPGPTCGCGRPRTASSAATGSGSRSPAAPSRATPATRAPASRPPPPPVSQAADQEVYHDPAHPSAIILPVRPALP